jgi:hypothetical protein
MIYLQHNPLLKEPLQPVHIKTGSSDNGERALDFPSPTFTSTALSKKYDLNMIFLAGPGHGAPGVLGPVYLEGNYSEIYTDKSEDEAGLREFFKQFSFPGGIGSHCTPETPGAIHEGGELGYVLSHACGAAFDNPDLIVAAVVGDGEAETGALSTSWQITKFLNPIRDGAVLPILHLNGYKVNNPTLLARNQPRGIGRSVPGLRVDPYFVEGSDTGKHAPGDGGHRRALRVADSKGTGGRPQVPACEPPPLADDRATVTQGLGCAVRGGPRIFRRSGRMRRRDTAIFRPSAAITPTSTASTSRRSRPGSGRSETSRNLRGAGAS